MRHLLYIWASNCKPYVSKELQQNSVNTARQGNFLQWVLYFVALLLFGDWECDVTYCSVLPLLTWFIYCFFIYIDDNILLSSSIKCHKIVKCPTQFSRFQSDCDCDWKSYNCHFCPTNRQTFEKLKQEFGDLCFNNWLSKLFLITFLQLVII